LIAPRQRTRPAGCLFPQGDAAHSFASAIIWSFRPRHGKAAARNPPVQDVFLSESGITNLLNESRILRLRHMLEAHGLGQQILTALNSKPIYRGLVRYSGSVVGARTLIHIRNCHHILKSQLLSVGIFFAYSPSETALSLASVQIKQLLFCKFPKFT
jgi:hypothetical protein